MRPRHAALLSLVALTGLVAGCGGGSVDYNVPKTVPALTAPPSGGTPAASAASTTATTATTSTTATTAAPATADPSASGGASATPPATTTPSNTGGTATPAPTAPTDTGGGTTTNSGGAGGADFNAFCQENPGAC
jgi:cytoskeletal protein RodZ